MRLRPFLASPPPKQTEESEAGSSKMVATRHGPKSAAGRNHFETVFKEAIEGGNMEVRATDLCACRSRGNGGCFSRI